jgi:hypothetical protein
MRATHLQSMASGDVTITLSRVGPLARIRVQVQLVTTFSQWNLQSALKGLDARDRRAHQLGNIIRPESEPLAGSAIHCPCQLWRADPDQSIAASKISPVVPRMRLLHPEVRGSTSVSR